MSLFKAQITVIYSNGEEVNNSVTVECEFEEVENKVFETICLQENVEGVIIYSFIDENGSETVV